MITTIILLSVALLISLVYGSLEHARLTDLFETIYNAAVAERDEARAEGTKMRMLLIPQAMRAQVPQADPQQKKPAQPTAASPFRNTRVPWRKQFSQLVAQHNTGQKNHDALVQSVSAAAEKSS
jgi:hypothetical protein